MLVGTPPIPSLLSWFSVKWNCLLILLTINPANLKEAVSSSTKMSENNFFTVWVYLEITQDKARITVKDGWVKVSQWTSPLKHFSFILSIKTDKGALPCGKKSYEWVNWILLQGKGRGFIGNSIAQLELVPIMTACLFLTAFWKQRKTR